MSPGVSPRAVQMKDKTLKPNRAQMKIKQGDHVRHSVHGFGLVLKEWGTWRACCTCYAPHECSHIKDQDRDTYTISGAGIFDVNFGNEIRSINRVWLTPL